MDQILEIIRTRELRIVVLAVVLGQAVASGLSQLIHLIVSSGNLFLRGGEFPSAWLSAAKATIIMALTSLVLWVVVAGGAVLLIHRLLRTGDDRV